nr:MAG TPA: hypothetical protein [Caudoviricetes sp.]
MESGDKRCRTHKIISKPPLPMFLQFTLLKLH